MPILTLRYCTMDIGRLIHFASSLLTVFPRYSLRTSSDFTLIAAINRENDYLLIHTFNELSSIKMKGQKLTFEYKLQTTGVIVAFDAFNAYDGTKSVCVVNLLWKIIDGFCRNLIHAVG